jgi:hypothetical protein
MSDDSVLIGCPTYKGLDSCLDEYLAAVDALEWKNRRLILVDNTDDEGEYAFSIAPKVEAMGGTVKHVPRSKDWEDTFFRSWCVIANHAEFNGYDWVFSLEGDVIVPPLTLDTMLNVAGYITAPFVTHTYPYHNGREGFYQGLGCTLMKTGLLTVALSSRYKEVPAVEAAIYDVAKRNSHASLHQLLDIKHVDPEGRYWKFERVMNDEVAVEVET